ncbi:nicotianamine synthase family protein [Paenactinomyces guangxiensis]|uniref:Nicotianamine synthase n=1 Tax=Paenactinomyces guangxiensis TaxID=1490290 RepID=A0A7W2A9I9_9BACL|nr:nicotianamine synthase family protein [Paenactinomyces guangxiensis]MBA4495242.1 hypothetical protein [Paenactinomyces guangxiensis]MBH8592326.1 hypothetical protein [Paenactinomyces guangxiensis]
MKQTVISRTAADLIEMILKAHQVLHREQDLSPGNPLINETLTQLVSKVCTPYTETDIAYVLNHPKRCHVQSSLYEKLGEAEGEMERYYAQLLSAIPQPGWHHLRQFLYWDNYVALVNKEVEKIVTCHSEMLNHPDGEVAFVGAGSLPLSAILLSRQTQRKVICIDLDPDACMRAETLIRNYQLSHHISVIQADGREISYQPYSIIFLASLVFKKADVIRRIQKTAPRALIAVRSADGLHQILYEQVNVRELEALGLSLTARTESDHKVINSTLFFES